MRSNRQSCSSTDCRAGQHCCLARGKCSDDHSGHAPLPHWCRQPWAWPQRPRSSPTLMPLASSVITASTLLCHIDAVSLERDHSGHAPLPHWCRQPRAWSQQPRSSAILMPLASSVIRAATLLCHIDAVSFERDHSGHAPLPHWCS